MFHNFKSAGFLKEEDARSHQNKIIFNKRWIIKVDLSKLKLMHLKICVFNFPLCLSLIVFVCLLCSAVSVRGSAVCCCVRSCTAVSKPSALSVVTGTSREDDGIETQHYWVSKTPGRGECVKTPLRLS